MDHVARKPMREARGQDVRPERPRRRGVAASRRSVEAPADCSGRTPRPRYLPLLPEHLLLKTESRARAGDSAETREALRSSGRQAATRLSLRSCKCSSAEDVSDESTTRAPRSHEPRDDPKQIRRGRASAPGSTAHPGLAPSEAAAPRGPAARCDRESPRRRDERSRCTHRGRGCAWSHRLRSRRRVPG